LVASAIGTPRLLRAQESAPAPDVKADAAAADQAKAELKAKLREELKLELKEELKKELMTELKQELKLELLQVPPKPTEPVALFSNFIERMPPSAYPDPWHRGIPGGSLWMTFHGLQWPYYPKTGIGVSGYVWLDSGYEQISRGNPSEQSIKYWLQQGRLVLRVTPTYTRGRFFIQGQAELVANKDQSLHQPDVVDTDDLWIRAGMWNLFDVQVGRYEGWEVYHFGMGLDLYTLERNGASDDLYAAPAIYGVTYAFYRPAGVGQAAVHFYPTKYLRFEAGTQFGNELGSNTLAVRPVAIFDIGWLKIKAGLEYKKLTDQKEGSRGETTERGLGGSVQFVFNPYVEFGFNGAYGLVDHTSLDGTLDEKGSNTTYSLGLFANGRVLQDLLVGIGVNGTHLEDLHYDPTLQRVENFTHWQTFGAVQYLLFKTLYIKAVAAYARADFAPTFGDPLFKNQMYSGRIRLLYLF
jgi:hypothetical protein